MRIDRNGDFTLDEGELDKFHRTDGLIILFEKKDLPHGKTKFMYPRMHFWDFGRNEVYRNMSRELAKELDYTVENPPKPRNLLDAIRQIRATG